MAKLPSLDHVKFVKSKGRVYAYFNTGQKVNGKAVYARLPDPSAPGFFASYAAFVAGRTKRAKVAYTVADFIDSYLLSAEYRSKAKATQNLYRIQLAKLSASKLGKHAVDRIEPRHIRAILEGEGWAAGTQNAFVSATGALYKWGREQGKTTVEPTRGIGLAKGGQHEPWPEHIVEAALSSDNAAVRLAVHLLLFAGQRIGDTCKMRWSDIRGGYLYVKQEKTGKVLEVRISEDLQAELDRTPRRGLHILTNAAGGPIRVNALRLELQAFTEAMGAETVPHGLRKNAVIALLEAESSVAEVAAITGQTYRVVEHYAARVNTRKMGSAAILKLDAKRRRKVGE